MCPLYCPFPVVAVALSANGRGGPQSPSSPLGFSASNHSKTLWELLARKSGGVGLVLSYRRTYGSKRSSRHHRPRWSPGYHAFYASSPPRSFRWKQNPKSFHVARDVRPPGMQEAPPGPSEPRLECTLERDAQTPPLRRHSAWKNRTANSLRPRRNAPPPRVLKFKILMNDGMDVPNPFFQNGGELV